MTAIPEIIPYVEYKAREIPYGGPDYTRTEHHAIGVLLDLEDRLRCLERTIKSKEEPMPCRHNLRTWQIGRVRMWCKMMLHWCDELEK